MSCMSELKLISLRDSWNVSNYRNSCYFNFSSHFFNIWYTCCQLWWRHTHSGKNQQTSKRGKIQNTSTHQNHKTRKIRELLFTFLQISLQFDNFLTIWWNFKSAGKTGKFKHLNFLYFVSHIKTHVLWHK